MESLAEGIQGKLWVYKAFYIAGKRRKQELMSFIEEIKQKARNDRKTIILPESDDRRVIKAASQILEEKIADVIMIGEEEKIMDGAHWNDVSLDGIKIINPETCDKFDKYRDLLYELRKEKGMTVEKADSLLRTDYTMFGVVMLKAGDADGLVSGANQPTADTLRPALQVLKTAPDAEMVSGFFVLCVPDCKYGENGTLIFADCGLNQDPDAQQLAVIAHTSAKSYKDLVGAKPVVAMLSHSTMGSAKHALVDKVREATRIAKEKYPAMDIDGEMQLDAAIVPEVARMKAPGSEVAGHANVLIFPNLDAGNIGYKLVQRFAKAEAYGPMLQGLAKPVNDLSRGCTPEDIVGVVALTAVQAQLV